jgi:hypothetical protein
MPVRPPSLLALSLSLALVSSGCSKPSEAEGEAKPAGDAAKPAGDAAKPAAGDPAKPETTDAEKPVPTPDAGNPALAAAVASMIEAETSYPVLLDPLLDLLPAGSQMLVVVRDVDDLLAVADATVGPIDPAMRAFAAAAGGDAAADVTRTLDGYTRLQAALHGPEFALDKGLVVGDVGGKGVVIYGASKPDALPTLLRSLGAEGDDLPAVCKAVDGMEGYVACTDDAETLAKYAPGKEAAAVRAKLGERLGTKEIDRANVLAHVGKEPDPGKHVTFAVATTPGLLHFSAGLSKAPEELARMLGTGPSPALGLVAAGTGFYWGKLDPTAIAEQAKEQPFMVRNVLGTLTGEILFGSMGEPSAIVLLAGVSDPAPAGGLVAMAGLQVAAIPKTLPDGSSLEVGVETLKISGKDTQVLHAKLTPAGSGAELFTKMGLVPEAWLFSAGGYAGVAVGAGKDAVEKIAAHTGGGLAPEAVRALPKPLAEGLVDGEVALAMHLSMDGLQSPQVAEAFEMAAKSVPASELPPGVTPSQIMSLARAIIAPMSGLSLWMGPPKDRMIVHMAVSLAGDPRTEEGKAALAAMTAVASGGDPATTYGELAGRFAGSDRLPGYEARAGKRQDGALASMAALGALAGFVLLGARSGSAVMSAPSMAMPRSVEAVPPIAMPEPR